jgi:hypothetical protein
LAATALPNLIVAGVIPAVYFLAAGAFGAWPAASISRWRGTGDVRLSAGCRASRSRVCYSSACSNWSCGHRWRAPHQPKRFFIAPPIVTRVTGVVYIASGLTPTPRVSKVLADLVPHSVLDVNDPGLAALLREGSLLDGAEQPLIAVVSLIMIVNLSITVYVAVHSLVSWVVLALMAAIVTPFLLGEVGAVDMRSWRPPVDLDLLLQSGVVMGQTLPVSSWVAPATGWPVCRACRPPGG